MRPSILKEFGSHQPRAIVLDDHATALTMTARRLRELGFAVIECNDTEEFARAWKPGTVDVIIADWELSGDGAKLGDQVLAGVRRRDWDVPFVLVSGKLHQDHQRAGVLEHLLQSGGARFVTRGDNGIEQACVDAQDLIERRDLALLKVVLSLRDAALAGEKVRTTSGEESVEAFLEAIVAAPNASHNAERPIARARSRGLAIDNE